MWFLSEDLLFPSRPSAKADVRWIPPTYHAIHTVLNSPVYADVYLYECRTRQERYVDSTGQLRTRIRQLPRSQWQVLIREHHAGFIDWQKYEMNQTRIARNTRPRPHQAGSGAIREGAALLQGLATCGGCGRKVKVYYQGSKSTPGYYCPGSTLSNGRSQWCLRIGGRRIDQAVAQAFLNAVTPAGGGSRGARAIGTRSRSRCAIAQWRLQVERAQYEADRAERRYRAVEPENRLVARNLEAAWEQRLHELTAAQPEL